MFLIGCIAAEEFVAALRYLGSDDTRFATGSSLASLRIDACLEETKDAGCTDHRLVGIQYVVDELILCFDGPAVRPWAKGALTPSREAVPTTKIPQVIVDREPRHGEAC